jgi:hypothetical protein
MGARGATGSAGAHRHSRRDGRDRCDGQPGRPRSFRALDSTIFCLASRSPRTAPIHRLGLVFAPPDGAHMRAVDRRPRLFEGAR